MDARSTPALHLVLACAAALAGFAVYAPHAAAQTPLLSSSPALYPAFSPSVSDYVTRCQPSNQLQVTVSAPSGESVSVDGAVFRGGNFTQAVSLNAGQEFALTTTESGTSSTYYVRCLPSDFPTFTASLRGPTQAAYYVLAPNLYAAHGASWQYVALFDHDGVPVWWIKSPGGTIPADAKLLSDGNVVMTNSFGIGGSGAEEYSLTGSLARTINTVGNGLDHHDIQLLANGDYLVGTTYTVSPYNMTPCGGSATGKLRDFELQELTPSGQLVWSWLASDHIPLSEVPSHFDVNCRTGGDVYHWNSVVPDGNGYLLSFRNLNAVFAIDAATGAIEWKLGGTVTPASLTVLNDPFSATSVLCAQHDAQALPDGSVTVYDDGSNCNRAPRAVRYSIDTAAGTATLMQSFSNPLVKSSWCCGSARMLPGGDWVTDWGASRYVTEVTATGTTVFQLQFTDGLASYRAEPVLPGQLSIAALRAGMDVQYPR